MSEIENVSDQIYAFAQEVESAISDLMKERKLTFEQAAKCVELGQQSMHNDVLWKRLKDINCLNVRIDGDDGTDILHVRNEK